MAYDDKTILRSPVSRRGFLVGLGAGAAAAATGSLGGIAEAATPAAKRTIQLGNKGFTEEFIVADMYQLLLQKAGFKVVQHNLGETPIVQAALLKGSIDLYPEYTGTGLEVVLKRGPIYDPIRLYDTVKAAYQRKWHLTWLAQAPMNDTNAVAVKQATAAKYNIHTMQDLARVAPKLTFAGLAACVGREDCLAGMQRVYGIKFGHVKTFGTSQALIYSALLGGQADVAEVFSTDAQISHDNLVVPTDTRGIFLPDHIAPVVRDDLLRAYPVIRHTLNSLAPLITTPRITALNAQVTFGHKDPMAVARAFLHRHGML